VLVNSRQKSSFRNRVAPVLIYVHHHLKKFKALSAIKAMANAVKCFDKEATLKIVAKLMGIEYSRFAITKLFS